MPLLLSIITYFIFSSLSNCWIKFLQKLNHSGLQTFSKATITSWKEFLLIEKAISSMYILKPNMITNQVLNLFTTSYSKGRDNNLSQMQKNSGIKETSTWSLHKKCLKPESDQAEGKQWPLNIVFWGIFWTSLKLKLKYMPNNLLQLRCISRTQVRTCIILVKSKSQVAKWVSNFFQAL